MSLPPLYKLPVTDDQELNRFLASVQQLLNAALGLGGGEQWDRLLSADDLRRYHQGGLLPPGTRQVPGTRPRPPVNMQVAPVGEDIIVSWEWPDDPLGSHLEVFRAEFTPDLADAARVGIVTKPVNYFRDPGAAGANRLFYYWIRIISFGGIPSSWVPVTGTFPIDTTLPKIAGLIVDPAFASIMLRWTAPSSPLVAGVNIYRAPANDFGQAEWVDYIPAPGNIASDRPPVMQLATVWYYWLRAVSHTGQEGPLNAPDGTPGSTADHPEYVLELLTNRLKEHHLFPALTSRIDLIDTPTTGLMARAAALEAEVDTILSSLADIQGTPEFDAEDDNGYLADVALVKWEGGLYRALQDMTEPPHPLPSDNNYWAKIGDYASLGEAVSAHAAILSDNITRIETAEGQISAQALALGQLSTAVYDESTGLATKASITQLSQAISDESGARATAIQTVQTAVDENAAAVQTHATAIDGLLAQYIVKLDVNGFPAGYALASSPVDGVPFSQFMASADSFAFWNPSAEVINVTSITRSANTATATTATAHGLTVGDAAIISCAAQGQYNGSQRVTQVVSSTQFRFTVNGTPPTPATVAPGWPSIRCGRGVFAMVLESGKAVFNRILVTDLTATNFIGQKILADEVVAGISMTSPEISGGRITTATAGLTSEGVVQIYSGSTYANRGSAIFRVMTDGHVYAGDGTFIGHVEASSGSFAGHVEMESGYIASDVQVGGVQVEDDGAVTRITNPRGGVASSGASTIGAIVIRLPLSWSNTMLRFDVDVYLYARNQSFKLLCGGYNQTTPRWFNTFAQLTGNTESNNRVRFGHDGTRCVVIIGETDSVWQYPKVAVKNFMAGHGNRTIAQWATGWEVKFVTSLAGYTFPGAQWDYPDALLDAKSILGQGAFATQSAADWASQVTGAGKPANNADVTGSNTSYDTARVGGTAATTVRDNASNAAAKTNDWTRPGSTLINGNKIFTGDAYVDTLQIQGNAVTIPVSAYTAATIGLPRAVFFDPKWTVVQSATIVSTGAPIAIWAYAQARVYAEILENMEWRLRRGATTLLSGSWAHDKIEHIFAPFINTPGSGSYTYTLEISVRYSGMVWQSDAKERMLILMETKR